MHGTYAPGCCLKLSCFVPKRAKTTYIFNIKISQIYSSLYLSASGSGCLNRNGCFPQNKARFLHHIWFPCKGSCQSRQSMYYHGLGYTDKVIRQSCTIGLSAWVRHYNINAEEQTKYILCFKKTLGLYVSASRNRMCCQRVCIQSLLLNL